MILKRILKTEWIVLEQISLGVGIKIGGGCCDSKMREFSFLAGEI